MSKIERIEARLAYSDPDNIWIKLYFDKVILHNGKDGNYNRIVVSEGKKGVVIIPICNDLIGMVEQYRYPVGKLMWEFPRGFGDFDAPEQTAVKELKEEMNLIPDQLVKIGTINPDSGLIETEVVLFVAICSTTASTKYFLSDEITAIRWISIVDVMKEIASDKITDAYTLSGILKAKASGFL